MRRACIEAMKAVAALTDGSLPNQDEALQAGAPALLCQVAQAAMQSGPTAHPEVACRLPPLDLVVVHHGSTTSEG